MNKKSCALKRREPCQPAVTSTRRRVTSRVLKIREAFGSMPPLVHDTNKSQAYDVSRSQVAAWLLRQPDAAQFIFDLARETKAIVFCKRRQAWIGRRRAILPREGSY